LGGIDNELRIGIGLLFSEYAKVETQSEAISKFESLLHNADIKKKMTFYGWSVSDAIEYAYAIVKVTIIFDAMCIGNIAIVNKALPYTGGKILVCIVDSNGIRWVLPPNYEPSWIDEFK